jgi:hypothetical protein
MGEGGGSWDVASYTYVLKLTAASKLINFTDIGENLETQHGLYQQ